MNRIASLTLLAGLLAALAPGVADADPITFSATPFTGQATDLTNVGDVTSYPFTDSYGNALTSIADPLGTGYGINENYGLQIGGLTVDNPIDSVTLTLASATAQIGFSFMTGEGTNADYLTSATFSDGTFTDTFTGGASFQPNSIAFMGFTDDRAFTTVTLNFQFESSKVAERMTGYVTPTAVPEPVMAVNLVIAAAMGLGFRSYRRWLIATSAAYNSEESATPTPA